MNGLQTIYMSFFFCYMSRQSRSRLERSPCNGKFLCSNSGRDGSKFVKQIVTAPLPNARQWVRVSRILGDDHYKQMPRVTVGVAEETSLLNGRMCRAWVKNCQPFIGTGDVSKWVKILVWDKIKPQNTHRNLLYK